MSNMRISKVLLLCLGFCLMLNMLTACSSTPCLNCEGTPTKGFENAATNETEYYCKECYSNCAFCDQEATEYYTNSFEEIIFVCDECYEKILELNS